MINLKNIKSIESIRNNGLSFGRRLSSGFTLVELMVVMAISALLATIAAGELARRSEEVLAEGSGSYIKQVSDAAQRQTLISFNEYSNGTPIAGIANALQPTVQELVALGRLNGGFPVGPGSMPTRQQVRIDVLRQNCPGVNCTLTTLVCTSTPVNLGGANVRFDLAQTMVDSQGGFGGSSQMNNGTIIRGPVLNVANPLGNLEGIVCGSSLVDTALFNRFVTINDLRDPNLQGPLTVAGLTTLNGGLGVTGAAAITGAASVTGNMTVGACASILAATGRAGFGCANPNDIPVGYTGGVRTPDVVASGRILASDNPVGFTGSNTNYAYVGVSAGVAEIRTSGRAAADRLTPLGLYASGAACVAADDGSIARRSGAVSGLVVCQGGSWRAMTTSASALDACAVNGTMATAANGSSLLCVGGIYRGMDTIIRSGTPGDACTDSGSTSIDTANGNETLICRSNLGGGVMRYMRLKDVTQHLAFVSAEESFDLSVVAKPVCPAAASQTSTPVIQLIPKVISTSDGGIAVYAVDNGPSWTVYLRNGANAPLGGAPAASAISQVFCYYP